MNTARSIPSLSVALVKDRLLGRAERAHHALGALAASDEWRRTHGIDVVPAFCKIRDAHQLVTGGLFDCGIASEDWLLETDGRRQLIELADLKWYEVVIAPIVDGAARGDSLEDFIVAHDRPSLLVVTPYPRLVKRLLHAHRARAKVVRVYGTTEVLVPRFADMAVDCVETGRTIRRLGLRALAPLRRCSVKFVAHASAMRDSRKRAAIETIAGLLVHIQARDVPSQEGSMEARIEERINDRKFGSPDSEKYWWHHAFIFRCSSSIHPVLHMTTVTTPDGKMTVCPVSGDENGPNLEQAIAVAKRLAFEGANKIDLCSGFNAALAKEIQKAVGDRAKVAVSIRAVEL